MTAAHRPRRSTTTSSFSSALASRARSLGACVALLSLVTGGLGPTSDDVTAASVALSGTTTTVDLTSAATTTYGTDARKSIGAVRALWTGEVVRDGMVLYTGQNNDRDQLLVRVGGIVPTATTNGYFSEDLNMDGEVKYTGGSNDRDPILVNIGGTVPTASRAEQLP